MCSRINITAFFEVEVGHFRMSDIIPVTYISFCSGGRKEPARAIIAAQVPIRSVRELVFDDKIAGTA